jgi:integrase
MTRKQLTDRFIKSRKKAAAGQRDDYPDGIVPGLALRVTDRGHRSFVLVARYPLNPKNPTRRALGDCYVPAEAKKAAADPVPAREIRNGALTLAEARAKAREWLDLIGRGIDPRVDEERQRATAQRQQVNTFATVAGEFLERHGKRLAKSAEAERIIEGEFVKRWGARPITDIMPEEVAAAIRAIVKRGAPYQAHNALGYIRRLFNWAIGTHEFGITTSPVEQLRPADLIGKREARNRVLADDELRLVWKAAREMGYPYGPLLQLLILTGQREREVADMSWREIDLNQKLWTVPPERMKGGAAHEVPLSPDAVALLEALPRWNGGDFVFSTTNGQKPVNGFSKAKVRIDKLSGVKGWVIHDLRRSVRTHLSALPVQDLVRELVIAHAKPGLHKVYDQHAYRDEKRECLTLWENRLRGILAPKPPAEVADLEAERARRGA